MVWGDITNPEAWKQAMANLLRRGGEVTDYIEQAPVKAGQAIIDAGQRQQALMDKAFDPTGKKLIRDAQAANQAATNLFEGPLGFAPAGITVWHGSPHSFEKFDMSKVGTGDSGQAYGHGMYFAESPGVANTYKGSDEVRVLANGQVTESPVAKQIIRYGGNPQAYIDSLQNKVNAQKEVLQKASKEEVLPGLSNYDLAKIDLDSTLNKIQEAKSYKSVKTEPVGNLYKVDIPDEHIPYMLDWDKPFSQQSKEVQKVLSKYNLNPSEMGESIYQKIIQENVKKHGHGGNQQRASEQLNSMGIKGIRYIDQGNREAGNTSNFVVFDPTDVKILEKNNQPVSRKEILEEQLNKLKD
jgi:hypothetical protein